MNRAAGLALIVLTGNGAYAELPGASQCLVYEAIGPQAPQREVFEVTPQEVIWRDDQGLARVVYDRADQVLTSVSPDGQRPAQRLDRAGINAIAADMLATAAALTAQIDAAPQSERETARRRLAELLAPRGPWAPTEAATTAVALPGADKVVGRPCRLVALQAPGRQVAEACVVDPGAWLAGAEVLKMLLKMVVIVDDLRQVQTDPWQLGWPSHALVSAARSNALPLRVRQALPGERSHELRLAPQAPDDHGPGCAVTPDPVSDRRP